MSAVCRSMIVSCCKLRGFDSERFTEFCQVRGMVDSGPTPEFPALTIQAKLGTKAGRMPFGGLVTR
jgi:hypothetical protein